MVAVLGFFGSLVDLNPFSLISISHSVVVDIGFHNKSWLLKKPDEGSPLAIVRFPISK